MHALLKIMSILSFELVEKSKDNRSMCRRCWMALLGVGQRGHCGACGCCK